MFKTSIKTVFIIFFLANIFSCEKDDICIDPTTPNLIIRFYDQTDNTILKPVTNLKVEVDSLGIYIEQNIYSSADSIAIPLRVDIDLTKIRLTKDYNGIPMIDDFTINYHRVNSFVSRSCGYKTNYHDINTSNQTNTWVQTINIIKQNIEDEAQAHLTITH